jgi:hypothetical protein
VVGKDRQKIPADQGYFLINGMKNQRFEATLRGAFEHRF